MSPESQKGAEQVFDQLRTSRMNVLYYEARWTKLKRFAACFDVFTLVALTIVGTGIWVNPASQAADVLIKIFSVIATAVSAAGLVLKPAESAARCEAHLAVRETQYSGLVVLMRRVETSGWSPDIAQEMETLCAAAERVHLDRFEASKDRKLLDRLWNDVNEELPMTYLQSGRPDNDAS